MSEHRQTLKWPLPLQVSSDFDDSVLILIAMTQSVVLAILCFNLFFCDVVWAGVGAEVGEYIH